MTAIREALDAASNAGVPVVWAGAFNPYHGNGALVYTGKLDGRKFHMMFGDAVAADLTVAAIKRGLLKCHYVRYECVYTPSAGGVYRVAIGRSGREPIDGEGDTELAALTAALKGMSHA